MTLVWASVIVGEHFWSVATVYSLLKSTQMYKTLMNNCEHSILYRNEELEHCCPLHFYFKYFLTTFVSIPKQYTLVLPFFFF